jgi:hypothetical protein
MGKSCEKLHSRRVETKKPKIYGVFWEGRKKPV